MSHPPDRARWPGARDGESPPTLDRLPSGMRARVQRLVVPATQPEWERQLQDLGFVPGAEVALLRRAPWGDPLVIAVEGSRFALRRAEARCIQLEATAPRT